MAGARCLALFPGWQPIMQRVSPVHSALEHCQKLTISLYNNIQASILSAQVTGSMFWRVFGSQKTCRTASRLLPRGHRLSTLGRPARCFNGLLSLPACEASSFPPRAPHRKISARAFQDDTVYALSSGQGKAGIAVIRISGPACLDVSSLASAPRHDADAPDKIYTSLCPSKAAPKPRYATVRTLFQPEAAGKGEILDSSALVLHFPAPRTVTGEEMLELHVHGGTATVRAVLSAIARCPSSGKVRYAEPGEFTKRAFLNDRLDLAQVESLGDTLDAQTEQQRRAAVRGNSGALGRTYEAWRQQLLLARGEIEALIDFSEDQHFDESPAELLGNVAALVQGILQSVGVHKRASQRSELLRKGIRIALRRATQRGQELAHEPNCGPRSLNRVGRGRDDQGRGRGEPRHPGLSLHVCRHGRVPIWGPRV